MSLLYNERLANVFFNDILPVFTVLKLYIRYCELLTVYVLYRFWSSQKSLVHEITSLKQGFKEIMWYSFVYGLRMF